MNEHQRFQRLGDDSLRASQRDCWLPARRPADGVNRLLVVIWAAVWAAWQAVAASPLRAEQPLEVAHLVITPLHSVAVPAPLAGVLQSLQVVDGQAVEPGQWLAQLDSAEAEAVHQQAVAQVQVADRLAAATGEVELAKQELELAAQLLEKQQLQLAKADQQAANQLPVQAAQKAANVAANELARATAARQRFADSVSQSEIDGLTLAHQHADLEAQQAELQRRLDGFTAQIEQQTLSERRTGWAAAQLRVQQTEFDRSVLALRAAAVRAEADRAALLVQRHRITAPREGVVAETFRQPGEWVQPGDVICRIVGLQQLRAEGFLTADQATRLRRWQADGRRLTIQLRIDTAADPAVNDRIVAAQLGFISPEIDAVNRQLRFWVTLENRHGTVFPGMTASVRIVPESQP